MRARGFGIPFPPLPLCEKCKSDCANKINTPFGNVCECCYEKELSIIWRKERAKKIKKKESKLKNNRICSTCSTRKACVKNGRKYKTCEECLIKKKEERLKRLSEEREKERDCTNIIPIPSDPF